MSIANYFYNQTTRKYIALFGTLFNKISIARYDHSTNAEVQRMIVPISYGPYQKFLVKVGQDPNLDRKTAITLPRMSFEIDSYTYDGSRKVNSIKKIRSNNAESDFQYAPAPYNINFSLYIMVKYAEDGVQIFEQIAPFFKPEWTTTVSLIDGIEPFDVPLILNSVTTDDIYEGNFETRRSILWTLNFTMKAWYLGPVRRKSIIKFVDTRMFDTTTSNTVFMSQVNVHPGLTANGEPTTSANNSIPWEQIEIDDDWGVVTIFRDELQEP